MGMDKNEKAFFELVKAGLWGDGYSEIRIDGTTDWNEVYQLAQEQSVQGLVLQGIDWFKVHNSGFTVPQVLLLQWIGEVQIIEQRNEDMNAFVAELIETLRRNDVYAILVKGQGIAQCYEKPLWRSSGDVDLLLSEGNYVKAKEFLVPFSSSFEAESVQAKHMGMTIKSWVVELHGTLRSCCLKKMDRVIDDVQKDVFYGGNVRSWRNGQTQVFLPSFNNDVFFVFTHIIKHFFREGVGLRQVCDWCRLLYTCRESLDHILLKKRLSMAGVMTEWKAFAAFAVNYLGMPIDAMPLYSSEKKWLRKAEKINAYILSVGNFGHNRENIYKESNYLNRKAKASARRISDATNHLFIFPIDSMKVFFRTLYSGLVGLVQGI